MKEDVIVLRSVFGKVNQSYHISPCRDPKTGLYPECVKRVDKFGDMVLSESDKESGKVFIPEDEAIVVTDGTVFDLNDPLQAARWAAIKNCILISPGRDARDKNGDLIIDGNLKHDGRAVLYVDHPYRMTEVKLNKQKLITKAKNLIFTDNIDSLKMKCKLLGKKMDNAYPADIEDFLSEFAQRNPQKIIDLYTGTDTEVRILFYDAVNKGVIHERNGVFMYGDKIMMGIKDEAVIAWLKDPSNQRIRNYIVEETYPDHVPDVIMETKMGTGEEDKPNTEVKETAKVIANKKKK